MSSINAKVLLRVQETPTMWLTAPNRLGIAGWASDQQVWMVHARGGADGIRLLFGDSCLSIASAVENPLPVVEEQFVRGDELHLSYPQPPGDKNSEKSDFGFRVVIRPVSGDGFETTAKRAYFELLISIQTLFLETHPALDLVLPAAEHSESSTVTGESGEIHHAEWGDARAAILMGPHDAPFATPHVAGSRGAREASSGNGVNIRLFGEFMEKGVIRRARPWLVLDRGDDAIESEQLSKVWDAFLKSPVPLD